MPIENPLFLILRGSDAGSEQDYDLRVDELREHGEKGARVTLRLAPRVHDYVVALAATNRRSVAAEIQAALQAHETVSRMTALLDQDLQEQRYRDSDGIHGVVDDSAAKMLRMLRRDLAALWAASFGLAGDPGRLGPVLSDDADA